MKFSAILENVTSVLGGIRLGGRGDDVRLGKLDRGVLTVALLLAALDGTILPEEYAAFAELAAKCRGGSAQGIRSLLDSVLAAAGRLTVMAQVGAYSESERLEAFVKAAADALPSGFDDGSMADVRRAFALWVAVAVSDGDFSTVERSAVEALAEHYTQLRATRERSRAELVAMNVPMGVEDLQQLMKVDTIPLLESDFLDRAAAIMRGFSVPERREQSERELDELVGRVRIVVDGREVIRESDSLRFADVESVSGT